MTRQPIGRRILFWTARLLTIGFALFVGVFALDVFGVGYTVWQTIVALIVHLLPTILMLLLLALAWRRAWLGGIAYPALGILYLVMSNRPVSSLGVYILSGPLFILGALFLIDWLTGMPSMPSGRPKKRSR